MEIDTDKTTSPIDNVRERIRTACDKYSRDITDITLIAVSKTRPASSIRELATRKQSVFAENYVQEGISKVCELSDLGLDWHFIGHLQSNKSADVAQHFSWVHSIDRLKIAQKLNEAAAHYHPLNVLIQVKLDDEENKAGVDASNLSSLVDRISDMKNLRLRGLMSIPKPEENFQAQRQAFSRVRDLADNQTDRGFVMDCLSMGMSNDLEAAIAEGATHLRVGTALFGPRDYNR